MSSEAVSPGPQVTAEWIPLGQRLLERGLVSGQELERALDLQRRLGGRLGGILVRSGAISENTLMQVLAEQLRLPLVGDDLRKPSEESIAAFLLSTPINTDWFVEEQLVVWEEGEQLLFAARDPLSPSIRAKPWAISIRSARFKQCCAAPRIWTAGWSTPWTWPGKVRIGTPTAAKTSATCGSWRRRRR